MALLLADFFFFFFNYTCHILWQVCFLKPSAKGLQRLPQRKSQAVAKYELAADLYCIAAYD